MQLSIIASHRFNQSLLFIGSAKDLLSIGCIQGLNPGALAKAYVQMLLSNAGYPQYLNASCPGCMTYVQTIVFGCSYL